ncbi:MAG: SDR family oxidoreductase [Leptospirales bacterium]
MPSKIAFVTGSTFGIGLAISDALAREGYRVGITGRRQLLLEELIAFRKSSGLLMEDLQGDLEDPHGPDILFEQAMELFGGRLDLLVNKDNRGAMECPGMSPRERKTLQAFPSGRKNGSG